MSLLDRIRLAYAVLKGGVSYMVDVYIALIVKHVRTIEQVPAQLQPAVLEGLAALGLDGYGNPL